MSRRTAASNKAIRDAWRNEQNLVKEGKGTRDWTISQQKDILERGKLTVYLTGYKHNKPIKKGEWIEEKYLKKGTLTYKYKKIGKFKKPKVYLGHTRGEIVDYATIIEPYADITGIKNNTYVLSGTYKIKPVYFKNTTGKGTNKVFLKIHPYDALNGRAASNFRMYRCFKGSYKSIRSLVYSLKLTCLNIKISKGTPKVIKKTYTYYGKSTLNKKAPKKCAKEKLKLYNNSTSTLIK